jgi:hypothetical protein
MKKSKRTDARIERLVGKSPGLSLYQLSRRTRWSLGKVDGAVSRLVNAKNFFVVIDEQNGRRQSQVFPIEYRPTSEISIPTKLLQLGNPTWLDHAFVYALDKNSIGVTGKRLRDWDEVAMFSKRIPMKLTKDHVAFKIPQEFVNFYQLNTRFFTKSVSANHVLISVGSPIQERRPYPS